MKQTMKQSILILLTLLLLTNCGGGSGGERKEDSTQVDTTQIDTIATPTININVYLENSGSMDGYVNGGNNFASTLYRYLSKISATNFFKDVNLHYINSEIIPLGNKISLFSNENLTLSSFKEAGGKRGSTDISKLFEMVLENTNDSIVSLLVSDFIFSPGDGINAGEYLEDQKTEIITLFSRYLKRDSNLGVLFYQFYSNFKGVYYNITDQKTFINNDRPFYVCVLGKTDFLKQIIMQDVFKDLLLANNFSNEFSISSAQKTNYSVILGSGRFERVREDPKASIKKAEKDRNGLLTCNVKVDFSNFLLDDTYLKNKDNYTVNDPDFEITKIGVLSQDSSFTHLLGWQTEILKPTTLSIKLMKIVPQWVEAMSDDSGVDINAPGAMGKTYGLKYLIGGIYEAFAREKDYYAKIDININK